MLDVAEINHLLERFTYKPGWRFEATSIFGSEINLTMIVSYPAMDSFNTDKYISVGARRPFPAPANEEMFWHKLLEICEYMERHEAREWFKVDGKMPFNPHREQVA